IIIKNASLSTEMRLQPKAISLDEVVIGSQRAWDNNLEIFKQQFLGWSRNGNHCVILNPKVVHFTTKKNLLMANADEFLIIENKRLGYRIRYLLQDFGYNSSNRTTLYHGEFSFEELNGTDAQKKEWEKNRADTYKGSFKHFLRSVYANNVLENGFITKWVYGYGKLNSLETLTDSDKLVVINMPVKFDTLITAIDSNFISLKFKQLYIAYDPKQALAYRRLATDKDRKTVIQEKTVIFDHDASLLKLSTPQAVIDSRGNYTDYRSFFIKGYWANARMGEELPVEYVPPFAEIPRGNMPVNKPVYALQNWANNLPQEKTYLHMDKPYYALGDTIWFKGYLTTGSRHQLSSKSGAVYVDLIDEQNKAVKTLKLPVNQGTIAGNITLGEDINAGSYRMRAHTQWMRNAGEDYFFDHTFTIGKPVFALNKNTSQPALQQTDVQFFPEGGNLVTYISSRVGFKATGTDGLGVPISGTITDNDNNAVAQLNTQRAGMGNFLLRPLPGKSYTANVKFADGTTKDVILPSAVYQGYTLSVYQPNKDSVLVRIQASSALQHTKLSLIAHSSGELIYTTPIEINGAMTSVWLDKSSFPSGIAQFTIFNADSEPLNERIAFIRNVDRMQLSIKTPTAIYKSREHVQLELDAHDSGGAPIAANFSAAVIDENKVPIDENAESTIFSNLLLSSDIKGYIEKPNYYFSKDSDDVNKALDNLMLTQGYRRFEWRSLLNTVNTKPIYADAELGVTASGRLAPLKGEALPNTNILLNTVNIKPAFPAEGVGVTISGTVTTLTHKLLPNANVLLISLNARIRKITTTDDNGRFKFDSLMFADSARFAVQARDAKNTDHVIITTDSIPKTTISAKPNLADVSIIKSILKKAEDDGYPVKLTGPHVLKQVNIKAIRRKDDPDISIQGPAQLPDEESADRIITIPDNEPALTLGMFLQAKISGVIVEPDNLGLMHLVDMRTSINVATETVSRDGFGIVLDGVAVGDKVDVHNILTGGVLLEDIARILVVRTNLAMANSVGKGIFIITKSMAKRKQYNPAIANLQPKGFNKVRQFYSPRYDRPDDNANKLPDLRTTIFWDPYINTDVTGKAMLNFYNADGPGTYRVVVEGINAAGELGRQVYTYKVE
ncbi:MAG: carboxypeptidase regulatory-like domain-containing protein, partial [Mucilaginibacter sp.]|nr:carboxypeptidase regulatory-like domain-containing protein [Mucilaginibacter sp.]